jgi:hypothetical protein
VLTGYMYIVFNNHISSGMIKSFAWRSGDSGGVNICWFLRRGFESHCGTRMPAIVINICWFLRRGFESHCGTRMPVSHSDDTV